MTVNDIEEKILVWSKNFVDKLDNYDLIEVISKKNLSNHNNTYLKKFENYGNWDFIPDYALILKKTNSENNNEEVYELILINREKKSIGLRSIGEIMSYNRICNPLYSFLISDKGHSSEISYFMVNEIFREKLMNYDNKSLIIFSFEEFNNTVNLESVIPQNLREILID